MWLSVMAIFMVYAVVFILFEDYNRKFVMPFNEVSDWQLLVFSIVVMAGLGFLLYRYAHRMDERISREQAEKENRLRRELTHNISHELKTPVASILGYTDTILESPDISEDMKRLFIERTNVQAKRLSALLQDISALNRMDYAKDMIAVERVDVAALFSAILQETTLAVQRREMIVKNYLPQNIIVRGNRSLLYSIFRNLIDNAVNYAGQGTTIEVSATEQQGLWLFTFSDNGIGIPAEHLPRIFERFYRIDKGRSRDMGGTGLGLAIVKNAVQLHGGTINVSSPATGGLTFEFTLKAP